MIVTLSGITGIGKSFFKNLIVEKLNFKNLTIVTTREKRDNEIDGIDKFFVSNEEFEKMKNEDIISYDFEFLENKYGYKKDNLESEENQVTELHYSTIYDFKKKAKNVFSIYIISTDVKRTEIEIDKRNLPKKVQKDRLREIKEHIKEFSNNEDLRKQFDYIFVNNYDDESAKKLLQIVENKIMKESMIV